MITVLDGVYRGSTFNLVEAFFSPDDDTLLNYSLEVECIFIDDQGILLFDDVIENFGLNWVNPMIKESLEKLVESQKTN